MSGPAKDFWLPPDDGELHHRIRLFVADAIDRPVEEVGIDDHLFKNLNLDSLGMVAVLIDLAYEFAVPEPDLDYDLSTLSSVRALADYARSVERARNASDAP